jgi:hypothetical protein
MVTAGRTKPVDPSIQLVQPNGERLDYQALCLGEHDTLEQVLRRGTQPDLSSLSGWEFRGYNLIPVADIAGIRKFKKGFYRENPAGGYHVIQGYNVKMRQNSFGEPWIDVMKGEQSIKFGWYDVYPVRLTEPDYKYPNAVLINYNSPKNFVLDPTRLLRDYLVQVYPENPDLYLGKAYFALGPVRVLGAFFVLERLNKSILPA